MRYSTLPLKRLFQFSAIVFLLSIPLLANSQPIKTCGEKDRYRLVSSAKDCRKDESFTILNASSLDDSQWTPSLWIGFAGVLSSIFGVVLVTRASIVMSKTQILHEKSGRLLAERVDVYSEFITSFLTLHADWRASLHNESAYQDVQLKRQAALLFASVETRTRIEEIYEIVKIAMAQSEIGKRATYANEAESTVLITVDQFRESVRKEFNVS